jgi:hypothetical protein
MRAGLGPYRISWRNDGQERVGFNYGRVEPLGTALGSTVDTIQSIQKGFRNGDTVSEAIWRASSNALGSLVSQAKEKSFLRGFSDFLDLSANAISTDDSKEPDSRKMKQFIAGRAAMAIPNFIKQPLRELDDNYREKTDSFLQEMLYQAAPIGQKEAKVDPYGDASKKVGFTATRPFDPTDMGTDKVNPVDAMLIRWKNSGKWAKNPDPDNRKPWFPGAITSADFTHKKTGVTTKMDEKQLSEYRELAGKRASALLKSANLNYDSPTHLDIKKVKDIISQSRSLTKKGLAAKFSQ